MGGKGDYDGKPEHPRKVKDGFWISQYPVTNAQFDQFVGDKGYARKEYWAEAIAAKRWEPGRFRGWREGPNQYREPFSLANHPVVGMSWYEALAFTRWLGQRLRREFGLPSEAQWEYAARGPRHAPNAITPLLRVAKVLGEVTASVMQDLANAIDQGKSSVENRRSYPWGEGPDPARLNFSETGIGSTSAVGAFPTGVSLFGCEDMSGNVWEWTMTKKTGDYKDYDKKVDNRPDGSEASRVLRGGSFSGNGSSARCAYRNDVDPNYDGNNVGFRVVASPIPSDHGLHGGC
jgi:formylglycine-generating enzyme required for sulfatase activity